MKPRRLAAMLVVSVCLGLLEAAWTTPDHPGATYAGLGDFAITVVLVIVCWPRLWWVPGLSMLEEATQVIIGNQGKWSPSWWDWAFHHWSAGYCGINLYPLITFPLITIVGEGIYWGWRLRKGVKD